MSLKGTEIAKQASAPKRIEVDAQTLLKINTHTLRPLSETEVFVFKVAACDNEIDRDFEAFASSALDRLAELYIGKTVLFDHALEANGQCARVFDSKTITNEGKSSTGEDSKTLMLYCYIPRGGDSDSIIERIETGILKEVSVHVCVAEVTCSICKKPYYEGACNHTRGEQYGGVRCYTLLNNPTDAYELSFVPVPAQRGAGVTKAAKTTGETVSGGSALVSHNLKGDSNNMTKANRWQLEVMRSGIASELEGGHGSTQWDVCRCKV